MKSYPRDGDSNSSTPSTVLRAEGRPRLVALHNLVITFLGFVGVECYAVTAALEAERPRTMMQNPFSPDTNTASPGPSTDTPRTYPDGQRERFGILSPTIARILMAKPPNRIERRGRKCRCSTPFHRQVLEHYNWPDSAGRTQCAGNAAKHIRIRMRPSLEARATPSMLD
jgi:hypothetical protein